MIGVAARKAYDSVDHNYMQGVLEAYGFGSKCKNWIKLLSKNLKVNILVNGFTTESINIDQSVSLWDPSKEAPFDPRVPTLFTP